MLVRYYYKPQMKYPARIYVLYGEWNRRNMKGQGIMAERSFYTRSATKSELEFLEGCPRLHYDQYDDPAILAFDENRIIGDHLKLVAAAIEELAYRCEPYFLERIENCERYFEEIAAAIDCGKIDKYKDDWIKAVKAHKKNGKVQKDRIPSGPELARQPQQKGLFDLD